MTAGPRVLVVAHYASVRHGGEASIPLRLFGRLHARGVPCWLVTDELYAEELALELPPEQFGCVTFVVSPPGFWLAQRVGPRLPAALRPFNWGISQLGRQYAMVPVVRELVRAHDIEVVHQPISVSPVIPSPMVRLGAPVVMGPLNGGMELAPAFRDRDSKAAALVKRARPAFAGLLHRWWRGRVEAAAILVANDRTARLLRRPPGSTWRHCLTSGWCSEIGRSSSHRPQMSPGTSSSVGWSAGKLSTCCLTHSRRSRGRFLPAWTSSATARNVPASSRGLVSLGYPTTCTFTAGCLPRVAPC